MKTTNQIFFNVGLIFFFQLKKNSEYFRFYNSQKLQTTDDL